MVPLLTGGGLVRWIGTRDQLQDLASNLGTFAHHFLYASSGPSVGQWWLAHSTGGDLIAGAVKLDGKRRGVVHLRAGDVVELKLTGSGHPQALVARLVGDLRAQQLAGVPVGRLIRDAGTPV
jgi:hypothetical protein